MSEKEINYTPPISIFTAKDFGDVLGILGYHDAFESIRPTFAKRYGYGFTKAGYFPLNDMDKCIEILIDRLLFWTSYIKDSSDESIYAKSRFTSAIERYKEVLGDNYEKLMKKFKSVGTLDKKCKYIDAIKIGYNKNYIKL